MTREQEALTVQRVLDGNADEYEKLVLEYQKNVYNLALRMTGDPEDAADMAQEAFIKAYNSLSGYRGDSKFSVWLYRIVSNVCLDFLRAKKRRQTVSLSVTDDDGEDTELDIADESCVVGSEYNNVCVYIYGGRVLYSTDGGETVYESAVSAEGVNEILAFFAG